MPRAASLWQAYWTDHPAPGRASKASAASLELPRLAAARLSVVGQRVAVRVGKKSFQEPPSSVTIWPFLVTPIFVVGANKLLNKFDFGAKTLKEAVVRTGYEDAPVMLYSCRSGSWQKVMGAKRLLEFFETLARHSSSLI
jgi:hypothetical protein